MQLYRPVLLGCCYSTLVAAMSIPLGVPTWYSRFASNTTSQMSVISGRSAFDTPRITPINSTAYDWWYFDAASQDGKSSIVLTFFMTGADGMLFGTTNDHILGILLNVAFPNGTIYNEVVSADSAVVETARDGSIGVFEGTQSGWVGAPDLTSYFVTFGTPDDAIWGTLKMDSLGPAHYPCGPAEPGQPLEILPHVGWANAIPGANATVDFNIHESSLKFSGPGYHDKNWGDTPLVDAVGSWYWGHANLGPDSIVWFDALAPNGTEYASQYVSLNGSRISARCGGIKVRPTGANAAFPPKMRDATPDGFHIDLNTTDGNTLAADVTITQVTAQNNQLINGLTEGAYGRYVGSICGVVNGQENLQGAAVFEQFKFFQ